MIRQSERLLEATKREHYAAMQTLQLQHMNERIREARQIRHNTRHHIQTLQTLAAANDVDGIRDYLEQMAKHRLLAPEHPMQYCEHASLNAVLVYYCDWARHKGADVDVKAAVPSYISINNAEPGHHDGEGDGRTVRRHGGIRIRWRDVQGVGHVVPRQGLNRYESRGLRRVEA